MTSKSDAQTVWDAGRRLIEANGRKIDGISMPRHRSLQATVGPFALLYHGLAKPNRKAESNAQEVARLLGGNPRLYGLKVTHRGQEVADISWNGEGSELIVDRLEAGAWIKELELLARDAD